MNNRVTLYELSGSHVLPPPGQEPIIIGIEKTMINKTLITTLTGMLILVFTF